MTDQIKRSILDFSHELIKSKKLGIKAVNSVELGDAIRAVENTFYSQKEFSKDTHSVKVGVGRGLWARVAWIGILNNKVTSDIKQACYAVALFNGSLSHVYIGLGVGVTWYETTARSNKVLDSHIVKLREALIERKSELSGETIWDSDLIDFETKGRLPNAYKRGTIFTRKFEISALPEDEEIIRYLNQVDEAALDVKNMLAELQNTENNEQDRTETYRADNIEVDDQIDTLFWDEDTESRALYAWGRKKNLILQGAPGVGKTFWSEKLAELVNEADRSHQGSLVIGLDAPPPKEAVFRCQFHQSTSYEDFVQGYRPTSEGGFELKDGIFMKAVKHAKQTGDLTVLIIDEINRGNISKIFGELLSLIEADKRSETWATSLVYGSQPFWIPENFYILGMMNTADKSLAVVDYALRRRFAFIDVLPAFDSPCFIELLSRQGISTNLINKIAEEMGSINSKISEAEQLGPGFVIGHSFFISAIEVSNESDWLKSIIEDELRPLLSEYFFDNANYVNELISRLESECL